ncbi:hypothetical protein [Streptomyces xiaopingdaonensis]|uniref:hypothetical protein n=1 Tax=Streptomyces xiaopingdaonensis TaxID=1565415 RepID=UPI0012FEDC2C|nr:hypothetical protein [Streptomyces xiaopingdaonensis]
MTEEVDKHFPQLGDVVTDISYCTLSRDTERKLTVRVAYPQGYRTAEYSNEVDLKFGNEAGIFNSNVGRLSTLIHCSDKPRENNYPMLSVKVTSTSFEGLDARKRKKRFQKLADVSGNLTRKIAQRYTCPDREKLPDHGPAIKPE